MTEHARCCRTEIAFRKGVSESAGTLSGGERISRSSWARPSFASRHPDLSGHPPGRPSELLRIQGIAHPAHRRLHQKRNAVLTGQFTGAVDPALASIFADVHLSVFQWKSR